MGQSGIANFHDDLSYADKARLYLEENFYPGISRDGRFVGLERSNGSIYIQRHNHIDCVVAAKEGGSYTFEEKIVRWPGRKYTAMTIETHSNYERTQDDDIGDGWVKTSTADYLLYAFEQEDKSMIVWVFDMAKLREWFYGVFENYPISDTPNGYYTTRCRVVSLNDIPTDCIAVREWRI